MASLKNVTVKITGRTPQNHKPEYHLADAYDLHAKAVAKFGQAAYAFDEAAAREDQYIADLHEELATRRRERERLLTQRDGTLDFLETIAPQ